MRATLEFDLPEDTQAFEIASRAGEFYSALLEIDERLRSCLKHGGKPDEVMQQCRAIIGEACRS